MWVHRFLPLLVFASVDLFLCMRCLYQYVLTGCIYVILWHVNNKINHHLLLACFYFEMHIPTSAYVSSFSLRPSSNGQDWKSKLVQFGFDLDRMCNHIVRIEPSGWKHKRVHLNLVNDSFNDPTTTNKTRPDSQTTAKTTNTESTWRRLILVSTKKFGSVRSNLVH